MKLTDLDPRWVGHGGEGVSDANGNPIPRRERIGIPFDCACGCGSPVFVPFRNPIDGGPAWDKRCTWERTGDSFETLTLKPSILRVKVNGKGCGWHGFVTNGAIQNA